MNARIGLAMLAAVTLLNATPGHAGDPAAALYQELCAGCHGDGRVPIGPYPALFGNPVLTNGGATYVAIKALRGAGNMYPLCADASDDEVASLANYLAAANGSRAQPLTAQAAATLRPAAGDCPPVRH